MRHLTTAIATLSLLLIAAPALSESHRGHQRAMDDHHKYGRAEREQRHIERNHSKQHQKQEKKQRKQERREERQHRREVRNAYKAGYSKGYDKGHRKGHNSGHRHEYRATYRPRYRHGYSGHRPHYRPSHYGYGYRWRHLPKNFVSISIGAAGFYYSDGIFYRPATSGYVVAQPPHGAIVHSLPASALTVVVGGHNYYVAYDTYYLWDHSHRGYRVVPRPSVI
ncbi:DUF6515 family protein [Microbulbifer sp. VAAF005]|uniref:DUF6515 family protein n=1 Tax=Microbulbifer sp. VAAF005 TaxID=3034230 RepID=UPI0024ACCA1C|nr:DUF6515 family protein [Microbulbifer sp. VAAF005]WHI44490.1 DUF6515 family protein [Microbulbifer sp. VAAF005]